MADSLWPDEIDPATRKPSEPFKRGNFRNIPGIKAVDLEAISFAEVAALQHDYVKAIAELNQVSDVIKQHEYWQTNYQIYRQLAGLH